MIERAIESWLTSTNERNFQIPLCQVLLHQGHRVIYISPHRPLEQGKDVISLGPDGRYHAYQLKTGRIDGGVWRQIKGEIDELIELPIVHPSVDTSKIHHAYLVTNSDVTDEVRHQIDLINRHHKAKKRGYAHLRIINGDTLLKWFLDAQGHFLPHALDELHLFLQVRLADGRDWFPLELFQEYIQRVLLPPATESKANRLNAVMASVISTGYALANFQERENHFAMFQAWSTLLGAITRFGWGSNTEDKAFGPARALVRDEIVRVLAALRDEALGRDRWLEGDVMGDGDLVYRARTTMVLGLSAALETCGRTSEIGLGRVADTVAAIVQRHSEMWFWGESAFPFYFHVCRLLEANDQGALAHMLLVGVLDRLLDADKEDEPLALVNPYYGPATVLAHEFNVSGNEPMSQAGGSSFCLRAVVDMLARRNRREPVQQRWTRISRIALKEFVPKERRDLLVGHTGHGTNQTLFFSPKSSWAKFVAASTSAEDVADLHSSRDALHFLVLTHPQRLTWSVCKLLDTASPATSATGLRRGGAAGARGSSAALAAALRDRRLYRAYAKASSSPYANATSISEHGE